MDPLLLWLKVNSTPWRTNVEHIPWRNPGTGSKNHPRLLGGADPRSAADAPVGLPAPCKMLTSSFRPRDVAAPRGAGGPAPPAGSSRDSARFFMEFRGPKAHPNSHPFSGKLRRKTGDCPGFHTMVTAPSLALETSLQYLAKTPVL